MNPILAALNRPDSRNLLSQISEIIRIMNGKTNEEALEYMRNTYPQFKSFEETNRGKSIEQIAGENNVDLERIKSLL